MTRFLLYFVILFASVAGIASDETVLGIPVPSFFQGEEPGSERVRRLTVPHELMDGGLLTRNGTFATAISSTSTFPANVRDHFLNETWDNRRWSRIYKLGLTPWYFTKSVGKAVYMPPLKKIVHRDESLVSRDFVSSDGTVFGGLYFEHPDHDQHPKPLIIASFG